LLSLILADEEHFNYPEGLNAILSLMLRIETKLFKTSSLTLTSSLSLTSVAVHDQAPYKSVLTNGFVLVEKGFKMS
jgi:hypothetical protein